MRPFVTGLKELFDIQVWAQDKLLQTPTMPKDGAIALNKVSDVVNDVESLIFDPSTNEVKEIHFVALLPPAVDQPLSFKGADKRSLFLLASCTDGLRTDAKSSITACADSSVGWHLTASLC